MFGAWVIRFEKRRVIGMIRSSFGFGKFGLGVSVQGGWGYGLDFGSGMWSLRLRRQGGKYVLGDDIGFNLSGRRCRVPGSGAEGRVCRFTLT